ncbi:MAG TPA: hypothetical protein VJ870_14965 [Amycolatopsis sp.]|nr:hypothetical protein [Amycolatopsis sp.]
MMVTELLGTLHWRTYTRAALCCQLVSALERWWLHRWFAGAEPGQLLDGGA